MGDKYNTVTGAAVQAASVFLNREATLEKACDLIHEAGRNGADFVVFPEGFIPAHPLWYHFHSATGSTSNRLSVELFKNAVEVPGPTTGALADAAEEAGAYVVMGVCEKEPDTTGTMYNSQLFFSPDGELLGNHQKVKPTVGEKLVHAEGRNDAFGTVDTEYGPVSGLICAENTNPLAVFALAAEHTRIHGMSWPPYIPYEPNPLPDRALYDARSFANISKAHVISAAGVVDDRTVEKLALDEEDREAIQRPELTGGSVIVAPDCEVVAGPLEDEEGILYGDIDLERSVKAKLEHDYAGHYNRPDMFQLHVNKTPNSLYVEGKSQQESSFEPLSDQTTSTSDRDVQSAPKQVTTASGETNDANQDESD